MYILGLGDSDDIFTITVELLTIVILIASRDYRDINTYLCTCAYYANVIKRLFTKYITCMEEADILTIDEEFHALPLEGASSVVLKYFGFKESNGKFVEPEKKTRKEGFCRICGRLKKVKYSEITSNMLFFL